MTPHRTAALTLTVLLTAAPLGAAMPDLGRDWMVSHWPAGQTQIMDWSPDMVRTGPEGVHLILDRNPAHDPAATAPDAPRPFAGGEIQSRGASETGIWRWRVKAPDMVDGAVFGMFLYRADHDGDPWREYDLEFVGAGTTHLEINIHFEDATGQHVSLADTKGGPVIVDLGFDAAQGFHDYEIEVQPSRAIFRIDGRVVGDFGPADMPRGIWSDGPLKSFVDLWAASPAQAAWTGPWQDPGRPLVATIAAAELPAAP